MARIAGVNLPNQKRLEVGLTYIYGIGPATAHKVCVDLGLSPDEGQGPHGRGDDEASAAHRHEPPGRGDLRRERSQSVKRLQEIGAYRGIRHRRGLPVNGQRTKTNARTRKGPAKSVGRKKKATT